MKLAQNANQNGPITNCPRVSKAVRWTFPESIVLTCGKKIERRFEVKKRILRLVLGTLGAIAIIGVGAVHQATSDSAHATSGTSVASGVVLTPSTSSHYEFLVFTAPATAKSATVVVTASWADDWYPPPAFQHTSSFPNLVEVPYQGGFGCDFIRNYPSNNFVEFESGMDQNDPDATKTAAITVGPGVSVVIAGSDCSFGDNFTFHRRLEWEAFVEEHAIEVEIDIKPGSDPNCFNNNGNGVIPVAILSTDDFDANTVDPSTVTLEGLAVKAVGKGSKLLASVEDVNNDGLDDLVAKIEDVDGTFTAGSGTAQLTGNLFEAHGGTQVQGEDFICVTQ